MYKILMAGYHHWGDSLKVGSLCYAEEFAQRGHKVFYLSDWISPFHFLTKRNHGSKVERLKLWLYGGKEVSEKLFTYNPLTLLYPKNTYLLRSNFVLSHLVNFSFPNVLVKLCEMKFDSVDILWLDNILYSQLLQKVDHSVSILRISDNLNGFRGGLSNVIALRKKIINEVDVVITPSHAILEEIRKHRSSNVFLVPNGVDPKAFREDHPEPTEYSTIPCPRVVYVGALHYWFDKDILTYCARNLPRWSFVLIGKSWVDLKGLSEFSNIHFLGSRPHELIAPYMKHSDIGIIPFKADDPVTICTNPIKLYEYMASGLPVVATKWPELVKMNSPALLARNRAEFLTLLNEALESKKRPDRYLRFAQENTWTKRTEEVERILSTSIG